MSVDRLATVRPQRPSPSRYLLDFWKRRFFEDEPWPDPIVDFELSYMSGPLELELPVAHFGDSDLPAVWQELHDATPLGWYIARPTHRPDGRWTMYLIDTTERDPDLEVVR